MKKLIALLLSVLMLFSLAACGGENPTDGFAEVMWPTSELVKRIPVPESTYGDIFLESSDYFDVEIGNTTQEQFNAYVADCQEAGFTIDYSKSSDSFEGYDSEGYYVSVYYDDETAIMNITIEAPEESDDEKNDMESSDDGTAITTTPAPTTTTTTIAITTTTTAKVESSNGVGSDFKKAMDSYEQFMNRYVDFMKKYSDNPTDLGLLAEYASYMKDYAKFVEDFEDWENSDLNASELAYYVDVQARVSKKLLEVAQ